MENQERPTEQLTTVNGHIAVLKSFITGSEQRDIASLVDSENKFATIDKLMELIVISIDGETDSIVKRILDLQSQDTLEIMGRCNEIVGGVKKNLTTN